MKRTNAHEPPKFAKNSFLNSLINERAEEIVNDVFEAQLSLKGIQHCPTTRTFYHLFAPDNVLIGHGELMAMLISCGWDPVASDTSVDERVVEKCYVNLLSDEKFKAWRVALNASSLTVDEISSGNSNTTPSSSTTPPPSLSPSKTPSMSKSLSPRNGVKSDDNDIPMIEEEYQKSGNPDRLPKKERGRPRKHQEQTGPDMPKRKRVRPRKDQGSAPANVAPAGWVPEISAGGDIVAKQRGGAAKQKSLEYKPTCEYPKELTFIELENRVGTRVSYRGRKGSVTNRNNSYYIVAFDDDGNNTRKCGYRPGELLVLDSNDNEIPMTKEEYQKGKSVAKQRSKLPEYEPTCEYPKELTFIEQENRVGTRVSYRGRKGNVTGKKGSGWYIVTFDDDGNNTRDSGYRPRELLVLDSNDNEIPMTKEEYQKRKSVAKQRNKLPEYEPTCEYPKELLFIELENRVGTRVSYRGRKGSVTGKLNFNSIVTFDDDGNNTRNCGYQPGELLVLDSNDMEIPMTEEEYQGYVEYKPTHEYPKKLLFIELENRVGTRVSYRGRKGSVTGKIGKGNYIVTFDDDGNNTRKSGYTARELLVLDSNDNEIPSEYPKEIAWIHTTLDSNTWQQIHPPKLSVKNNGEPKIRCEMNVYYHCATKLAEQQAREGKIERVVVETLVQVSRIFRSNNTYDAVFSTEGNKRLDKKKNKLESTRRLQLPNYDAVLKTGAFLQDESNNKTILAGMVEEMEGLTVEVTAEMFTKNRDFYFIVGSPRRVAVNALGYKEVSFTEVQDKTSKVVKSGAVFVAKGGNIIDQRYKPGSEKECQYSRVATIIASAGFAHFVEGIVHMIIEKELNNHFRESDGTHMVGAHSEALMVKTGSGDEEYLRRLGIFWDTALKKAVGEGFNCHSEQV